VANKFGEALRAFRQASNDPDRLNRRLSQERLGELIGAEMEDFGFSGAAISDWERGESKISAENRNVLLALIKVLHKCGGLKTLMETNHFLALGNYRNLDDDETRKIFIEPVNNSAAEQMVPEKQNSRSNIPFLIENFFAISEDELKTLIAKAKQEGPEPSWPRVLAALMRKITDRFSITRIAILWVWVGVLAWWLIAPSLRLPFVSQGEMLPAMKKYVIGSLIVPLVIGLLVNTKDNEYWKQQPRVNPLLLRLYTYQGAGIGFNLGYFFLYPFALVGYYLNFDSSVWVEIAAVMAGLVLGNMGARVVPHNLWRAYGRLTFSDGAIFFVVAFMGPAWGFFFLEFYSILLAPFTGIFVILLAISILVIITTRQAKS
jgi:transcriptional regulator with XRE-family HTH domain